MIADVTLPPGFEFRVDFHPAWDKRATEPNKGQHYAEFRFTLIGPLGAIEWVLFTGWTVESALQGPIMTSAHHPIPATWGVHVRVAEDTAESHACEYVGRCVQGGFSFCSDRFYKALVLDGYPGLAQLLLHTYEREFAGDAATTP